MSSADGRTDRTAAIGLATRHARISATARLGPPFRGGIHWCVIRGDQANGETRARNRGGRDPVGRRGEGQAHRSPCPRDAHGRALPGRPQRRPPHRRPRPGLRPPARAERDPLRPHHARHRQRRRRGPGRAARGARHAGRQGRRHLPPGRERQRPPDHAVPPGARPGDRALPRQERAGDDQARHRPGLRRQGLPGRDPRAGPLRPQDLPREARRRPQGEERRPGQGVQPAAAVGRRHRGALPGRVRPPDRADGGRHGRHDPRRHGQGPRGAARGRPGHLLGPRPRDLSLRDLLQPGRRGRLHRVRASAPATSSG